MKAKDVLRRDEIVLRVLDVREKSVFASTATRNICRSG